MTRKERIRRKTRRILIGLCLLILVSLTAYGGERARGWALADGQFAVDEVAVIGNVLLAAEDVEDLYESNLRGVNLLKVDSDAVAEEISAGDWIEAARVKRVPPGRIEIHIKEREPWLLAAPKSDRFYDRNGVSFATGGREVGLDLPIVVNHAGEAGGDRIAALASELDAGTGWIDAHAAEIAVGEDGSVTVIDMSTGSRLLLGAGPYYGMRDRIETTWRQWTADETRYAEMDLRYRDQIVVRGPIEP